MDRTWLIGMVRVPPFASATLTSVGELDSTLPLTVVPSRITIVPCGAPAPVVDSCFAQDVRKTIDNPTAMTISRIKAPVEQALACSSLSKSLARQPETSHFRRIPHQQQAVGDRRMIPCLSLDGLKARQLLMRL